MDDQFIPSRKAAEKLGVHPNTLRRMANKNDIEYIRIGNNRLYNVNKFINEKSNKKSDKPLDKLSICYCRVSTYGQKNDLDRQVKYMEERFPNHTIIKDIGSGLNFKRKGLKTILDKAHQGLISEVVVAHKDRMCRFGFELIEYILRSQSDARIVILDDHKSTPEEELTNDLLQIITVFGARVNGLRKYHNKIKNDPSLSNKEAKNDS